MSSRFSWKARRKKFGKKKAPPPKKEPVILDEAAEVVKFVHAPLEEGLRTLRDVCGKLPKPGQAGAIKGLATDLRQYAASLDGAWLALREVLRPGDAAKFDATFGSDEEMRIQTPQKGSTYRYVAALLEKHVLVPVSDLAIASDASTAAHRAAIALRDGVKDLVTQCEAALATFRDLASQWLRSRKEKPFDLALGALAANVDLIAAAKSRALQARIVTDGAGPPPPQEPTPTLSFDDRAQTLVSLLTPGIVAAGDWLGPDRLRAVMAKLRSPLTQLARICAHRRSKFLTRLHGAAGIDKPLKTPFDDLDDETHDGDDFGVSAGVTLYGERLELPGLPTAILVTPELLRHGFSPKMTDAVEILKIARGDDKVDRVAALAAQAAAEAGADPAIVSLLEEFAQLLHVEDHKDDDNDAEKTTAKNEMSLSARVDRVLKIAGAPETAKTDVEEALKGSGKSSELTKAVAALEKEALTASSVVAETLRTSRLDPVDVILALRLLGTAGSEVYADLPNLVSDTMDVDAAVDIAARHFPTSSDVARLAIRPRVAELVLGRLDDKARDAVEDAVFETPPSLALAVILERWLGAKNFEGYKLFARRFAPVANYVAQPKCSVLWAPAFAERVGLDLLKTDKDLSTRVLSLRFPVPRDLNGDPRAMLLKADRVARNWALRVLRRGNVEAKLKKVAQLWTTRRLEARRVSTLVDANTRATKKAHDAFSADVVRLRVRRYFLAQQMSTEPKTSLQELLRKAAGEDATNASLGEAAKQMTVDDCRELLRQTADVVDSGENAQEFLEQTAAWTTTHRPDVAQALLEAVDQDNCAEALRLSAASFGGQVSLRDATAMITAATDADAQRSALAATLTESRIAVLLGELIDVLDSEDAVLQLETTASWTSESILADVVPAAVEALANGDKDTALDILKTAAENRSTHLDDLLGTVIFSSNESKDDRREEEGLLWDRLLAKFVAEEAVTARKAVRKDKKEKKPPSLRLDAVVEFARDCDLPPVTAHEAAALAVRFGRGWRLLREDTGSVDAANQVLLLGDAVAQRDRTLWLDVRASQAVRGASLLGEASSGIWSEINLEDIQSDEPLDLDALTASVDDADAAVQVAAFDLASIVHPRVVGGDQRVVAPPGARKALVDEQARRLVKQHGGGLDSASVRAALSRTDWAYTTSGDLYDAVLDRYARQDQLSVRDLVALARDGERSNSESAFVVAATRAGFERVDDIESCSRAGSGILRRLREQDPGQRRSVKREAFAAILASSEGGRLRVPASVERVLADRFYRRSDVLYEKLLEWLVPRGSMLELHVIARTQDNSKLRLQFCVDAWLPIGELRSLIARRLFWEAHRSHPGGVRLGNGAPLYAESEASAVRAAEERIDDAKQVLQTLSTDAAPNDIAAARRTLAQAEATYHRLTLVDEESLVTPAFLLCGYEETLHYVSRVVTSSAPGPVVKKIDEPKKKVERAPSARRVRRSLRDAAKWTPRDVAAYFREVEAPDEVIATIRDDGIDGAMLVFETRSKQMELLRVSEVSEFAQDRIGRALRTMRHAVFEGAWNERNAKDIARWPPSAVCAFVARSKLDDLDGTIVAALAKAGVDGHAFFGAGRRGVISVETLEQLGIPHASRIRDAAIEHRLSVELDFGIRDKWPTSKRDLLRSPKRRPSKPKTGPPSSKALQTQQFHHLSSATKNNKTDEPKSLPPPTKDQQEPLSPETTDDEEFRFDTCPVIPSSNNLRQEGDAYIARGVPDPQRTAALAKASPASVFKAFTARMERDRLLGPHDDAEVW